MSSEWRATVVLMVGVVAMAAAIGGVSDKQQVDDCITQLVPNLQGCLEAVQDPARMPSTDCCKGVSRAVRNQMKCLCVLYNSPSTVSSYGLNLTRLSEIPAICKVPADVSLCKTTFKRADAIDEPTLDLATIRSATDDFALKNKLGEGGFGVVYRGQLPDGREIAVKRLSRNTGKGSTQFANEVQALGVVYRECT
ncbi:YLS3 protein [Nymphaea thermarum]|nr:YLS3 protein [Nymphaea thermarum]